MAGGRRRAAGGERQQAARALGRASSRARACVRAGGGGEGGRGGRGGGRAHPGAEWPGQLGTLPLGLAALPLLDVPRTLQLLELLFGHGRLRVGRGLDGDVVVCLIDRFAGGLVFVAVLGLSMSCRGRVVPRFLRANVSTVLLIFFE